MVHSCQNKVTRNGRADKKQAGYCRSIHQHHHYLLPPGLNDKASAALMVRLDTACRCLLANVMRIVTREAHVNAKPATGRCSDRCCDLQLYCPLRCLPSPRRRVASSTSLCIPHASIRFAFVILRAYIPGYYTLNRYVFGSFCSQACRPSKISHDFISRLQVLGKRLKKKSRRDSFPEREQAQQHAANRPSLLRRLCTKIPENLQVQHRPQYLETGPDLQNGSDIRNKPNTIPLFAHFSHFLLSLLLPPTSPLRLSSWAQSGEGSDHPAA